MRGLDEAMVASSRGADNTLEPIAHGSRDTHVAYDAAMSQLRRKCLHSSELNSSAARRERLKNE